ncbi:MAG: peptidase T [Spirochaetes bacterium]|nr:MAG: peptidase T [Spirochaetota bacterium]RKX97730.1 MAG: peptidase T [Spirochaetota bacterium]
MNAINYDTVKKDFSDELLERFLRYTRIYTTSDETLAEARTPSTPGQWDLLRILEAELKSFGVKDVSLDEYGYLIARLPGNLPEDARVDTVGFMAHVDTSSDAPGENVSPQVHNPYDGKIIKLKNEISIDPAESSLLASYEGEAVITSDGTTLLGADDKAGVAEIMTAVHWLIQHPEAPRGSLEIIFTPDEETGMGMNRFPVKSLKSRFCFTMDGGREGEMESECYFARAARVSFKGNVIHPGAARGKLVNAVTMAGAFISLLPRNESPEATDGRYGNYWPHKVEGTLDSAELTVFYRSFDADDIQRRSDALHSFAAGVEAAFPGGSVSVETKEQYRNMREELDKYPQVINKLREAVMASGIEPLENPIRGGTDGSRLTAMGIPTPNIFAGGVSFHSRSEWVALPAMVRSVTVILNLIGIWSE